MEDYFNYDSVPFNYMHCLNSACARSESCLRHLVALHVPQKVKRIVAVNPANYPANAHHCPYFRSCVKARYAWGISSLFDNVPYKKAIFLKREILEIFPKTTYYRILHKERALSPKEQAQIAGLFAQAGVAEPLMFDCYTEEYDWSEPNIPMANAEV